MLVNASESCVEFAASKYLSVVLAQFCSRLFTGPDVTWNAMLKISIFAALMFVQISAVSLLDRFVSPPSRRGRDSSETQCSPVRHEHEVTLRFALVVRRFVEGSTGDSVAQPHISRRKIGRAAGGQIVDALRRGGPARARLVRLVESVRICGGQLTLNTPGTGCSR